MNQSKLTEKENKQYHNQFYKQVDKKASRKIEARQNKKSIWFVIGMFGMVGWSVVIPTLIGIAIGVWIDTHIPSPYSWTLMLLCIGLFIGCLTAWYWIKQESDR
ncbi:MAG: AtpZ/AtpI family protein [Crocosphaera sp.]